MRMNLRKIGQKGENVAQKYLKELGFKVVEANFRCKIGEIDIIAAKNKELYFVEVKTRNSTKFGFPLESINLRKREQVIRVAKYYLMKLSKPVKCHFSAIGILKKSGSEDIIQFFPDAFEIEDYL